MNETYTALRARTVRPRRLFAGLTIALAGLLLALASCHGEPAYAGGPQAEIIRPCVTKAQFGAMPEGRTQAATERWLGHPPAHGNPVASDNRDYSVVYKVCGVPWTKGGAILIYDRKTRKEFFAVIVEIEGALLDVCWTCPPGPGTK